MAVDALPCPSCGDYSSSVIDSRPSPNHAIRRRRKCGGCGERFSTYETYAPAVEPPRVELRCKVRPRRSATGRMRAHKARAKKAGVEFEVFDPLEIFERDGWVCQICLRPTNREAQGSYAKDAPVLDHIVPMSRGGGHTRKNTWCACWICNTRKGRRMMFRPVDVV
jgi:5-methylcytosine-specific restriction endonuclease McrA